MARQSGPDDDRSGPGPDAVPASLPFAHVLRLAGRDRNADIDIDLRPTEAQQTALARLLGLDGLSRLRFSGRLSPWEAKGWRLTGSLTARVRQTCVVTLEPVRTSLDLAVRRDYLPERDVARLAETPISGDPEDDSDDPDPFTDEIDIAIALVETLSLAIDPYPRADGAALTETAFAPPGARPLSKAEIHPFAALGALRQRMDDTPDDET